MARQLDERTISTQRIYQGRIVSLREDTVQLPNGVTAKREIVEHGDSVCIVALDPRGNVLLVRQYRKPAEEVLLEVPAGGIDPGESPRDAAERELQEETGSAPGQLVHLASFWMSPGYCTEAMYAFLATQLEPGSLSQEPDEDIEVERVPLKDVPEMINAGKIKDAKSITSLLLALQQIKTK